MFYVSTGTEYMYLVDLPSGIRYQKVAQLFITTAVRIRIYNTGSIVLNYKMGFIKFRYLYTQYLSTKKTKAFHGCFN